MKDPDLRNRERILVAIILLAIALVVGGDVITDFQEGVGLWHLIAEGVASILALFGVFMLFKGSFALRREVKKQGAALAEVRKEAENWRAEARRYAEGLSTAIDAQLAKWQLTPAEKEVAFLLLKGLSLKEVASVRETSEKTARVQSMSIYAKSGLSGRSELSAFFLEELLVPNSPAQQSPKAPPSE